MVSHPRSNPVMGVLLPLDIMVESQKFQAPKIRNGQESFINEGDILPEFLYREDRLLILHLLVIRPAHAQPPPSPPLKPPVNPPL